MSETLVQYGTSFQSKIIVSLITDVKFTKQILRVNQKWLKKGYLNTYTIRGYTSKKKLLEPVWKFRPFMIS